MDDSYSEDFIKGKITETIFELMFKEAEELDVLPLGYEHTTPILAQYQNELDIKKVLDNIKDSPDFALISQDNKNVYLVEVKYRSKLSAKYIIKTAEEINSKWSPCWLFVATPKGFYFESVSKVVKANGFDKKMRTSWIDKNLQEKYLKLLNKFIR